MNTLNEDLSAIKEVEDTIIANKVANFAYTDDAYAQNDANGVPEYNVNNEQNIPIAEPSVLKVNDTVLSKGYRAQASSVTRMMLNHFFGRMSYNLNKVNDNVSNLITTLITHQGTANGVATLDSQGKLTYSQLPESVVKKVNNILPTNGNVTLTANDVNALPSSAKGVANGVATLDSQGKLTYSQLPESVVKKVNNILPTNGNVTLTGENISISTNETTKLSLLDNVVNHNALWGGRELNSIISVDAFCTQVSANGYCKGVYVGDYWYFGSTKFRIVEFDSFYNQGNLISKDNSTFGNLHHAVIMPDTGLTIDAWGSDTNTGYLGSEASSQTLPAYANAYNVASYFNGHILYKKEYLSSACSTGKITATEQRTTQFVLPNCIELFGSPSLNEFSSDTMINCLTGGSAHQFSAFKLNPSLIFNNDLSYWLRDIGAVGTDKALVLFGGSGTVKKDASYHNYDLRPRFLIG